MNVYRYRFGYETPEQAKNNKRHGWDDEDSQSIYIMAQDSEEALSWGCEISEQYIKWLFNDQAVSWKAQSFAYWLEADFEPEGSTFDMEVVRVGELPDFRKWAGDMPTQKFEIPLSWRIILVGVLWVGGFNAITNLEGYARYSHFLQRGVETNGTVKSCVDNILDPCIAIIHYDVNGLDYQLTHPKWSCARKECFGTLVTVVYDPSDPNVADDLSLEGIRIYLTLAVFSGLIVIVTVIGFAINVTRLWRVTRNRQNAPNERGK